MRHTLVSIRCAQLACCLVLALGLAYPLSLASADHAPDSGTTVTSGPAGIHQSTQATFGFASTSSPNTFQCRLVTPFQSFPAWQACSSPVSYSGLSPGRHTFQVRRMSSSGSIIDSTSRYFEVSFPNGGSMTPVISGNGRYVAFASDASNLTTTDDSAYRDVFVYDTVTRTTELISSSASENPGDGQSNEPTISDDGRFVAFSSVASNLVPGDTNGAVDVFVRDRAEGTITRITDWTGAQWPARWCYDEGTSEDYVCSYPAQDPAMSGDGRFVAYTGDSRNILVYDRMLRRTVDRVSGSTGAAGDGQAPAISDDGRYVAFHSQSPLLASDTNGRFDVYVRDRDAGVTVLASIPDVGGQSNGNSQYPSMSDNGRYIAFHSDATNLQMRCCLPRDTSPITDVYVRDRLAGTTDWASSGFGIIGQSSSADANTFPSISGNGPMLQFETGMRFGFTDSNAIRDIYEWNFIAKTGYWMLSTDHGRGDANGASAAPSGSDDGTRVAFSSLASNLVVGDTNGGSDIVVHEWFSGSAPPASSASMSRSDHHLRARASNCGQAHTAGRFHVHRRWHRHRGRARGHIHRYVHRHKRTRLSRPTSRSRRGGGIRAAQQQCVAAQGGASAPSGEAVSESRDEALTDDGQPVVIGEELRAKRAEYERKRKGLWMSEAANAPGQYTPERLERMRGGRAPIGADGEPMEFHHKTPLSRGGSNDRSNLEPMSQTDHRRGGNYRRNHPK